MNDGMIALLKYFTYAGANGSGFVSDWFRIPEDHQNWQLTVLVHCRTAGSAGTARLATTWDTGLTSNPGTTASLATLTPQVQDITTGVGPFVRVAISSTADSIVTMSVFLTPKRN